MKTAVLLLACLALASVVRSQAPPVECWVSSDCNDGDACTYDLCIQNPNAPPQKICANPPLDCDDLIDCTIDACSGGIVTHTPDDTLCPENNLCEECECRNPGAGQLGGCHCYERCDDGWPCTADSCDLGTGDCTNTANDNLCIQRPGYICTCHPQDFEPGNPNWDSLGCECINPCDDGLSCTEDTLNPDGSCTYTPVDARCFNGDLCVNFDCDPNANPATNPSGCVYSPLTPPDDGIDCTFAVCTGGVFTQHPDSSLCPDSGDLCDPFICDVTAGCIQQEVDCNHECIECDPATGACSVFDNTLCNDNDDCTQNICTSAGCTYPSECTTTDLCNPEVCIDVNPDDGAFTCQTDPVDCPDGPTCAPQSCNPNTGSCESHINVTVCNDGLACTWDWCEPTDPDGTTGCHNDPVMCNDNNVCTLNECNEPAGCAFPVRPDFATTTCDDHNLCTVNDFCTSTGGCAGTPVDCDDNVDCTIDNCLGGACVHVPDNSACQDNDPCTVEVCSPPSTIPVNPISGCTFYNVCSDPVPSTPPVPVPVTPIEPPADVLPTGLCPVGGGACSTNADCANYQGQCTNGRCVCWWGRACQHCEQSCNPQPGMMWPNCLNSCAP